MLKCYVKQYHLLNTRNAYTYINGHKFSHRMLGGWKFKQLVADSSMSEPRDHIVIVHNQIAN